MSAPACVIVEGSSSLIDAGEGFAGPGEGASSLISSGEVASSLIRPSKAASAGDNMPSSLSGVPGEAGSRMETVSLFPFPVFEIGAAALALFVFGPDGGLEEVVFGTDFEIGAAPLPLLVFGMEVGAGTFSPGLSGCGPSVSPSLSLVMRLMNGSERSLRGENPPLLVASFAAFRIIVGVMSSGINH